MACAAGFKSRYKFFPEERQAAEERPSPLANSPPAHSSTGSDPAQEPRHKPTFPAFILADSRSQLTNKSLQDVFQQTFQDTVLLQRLSWNRLVSKGRVLQYEQVLDMSGMN